MGSIGNLKDMFYCFGVSLFNYSQVEVLYGNKSVYPGSYQHYYDILDEKIQYKDLADRKIFKL